MKHVSMLYQYVLKESNRGEDTHFLFWRDGSERARFHVVIAMARRHKRRDRRNGQQKGEKSHHGWSLELCNEELLYINGAHTRMIWMVNEWCGVRLSLFDRWTALYSVFKLMGVQKNVMTNISFQVEAVLRARQLSYA
jgi:hypothetical protein